MQKKTKRIIAAAAALVMLLALIVLAVRAERARLPDGAAEGPAAETAGGSQAEVVETPEADDAGIRDVVILYTNDVHCAVDANLGYAGLSACRQELEAEGNAVFLVDAGDEIQGAIIGSLTRGEAIVHIMNAVGYQLAIPGNHEFDYGTDRYFELAEQMDFPVVCCNFVDLETGETPFAPYVVRELGGRRIGFVGVTTPTSITSSTPRFFQNDAGEFVYGFCQEEDGRALYEAVQRAVDAARAEGAEYCILLSHLGIGMADSPFTSPEVIANTTGIDAVLDAHSHSVVEMEKVKNRDGREVLLSQTGWQLAAIGKLTIDSVGNIRSELITDYAPRDAAVAAVIAEEEAAYAREMERVVARTDYDLRATTVENTAVWLVRNNETNLADFMTDAFRAVGGAEIGLLNGGGIRTNVPPGDITMSDLVNLMPFGNYLVVRRVSGRALADALEYSVSFAPENFGGFLQVSGMSFDVDLDKTAEIVLDGNGMFVRVDGDERRISNVTVNGEPLDPEREYVVASTEYILLDGGNGYTMFDGPVEDTGEFFMDYQLLAAYLESLGGVVPEEYADPDGQERIHFVS